MSSCKKCKFVQELVKKYADKKLSDDITYLCRRYPPTVSIDHDTDLHPAVSPKDWCGEFAFEKQ